MPKNPQPLSAPQEMFIRMSARACSRAEILQAVFHIDMATAPEKTIHNADATMSRWRKRPEFESVWKDEVRQILFNSAGKALKVLDRQLDDERLPWLQNKAANDVLAHSKSQIYGDEERTVNVQIAGLPDLGSPDQEDG